MKRMITILVLCFVLSLLCSCLTEEQKQEILADMSSARAASNSASLKASQSASSSGSSDSTADSSSSSGSDSTAIDNKPPKSKDGVTIHITEEELKKAYDVASGIASDTSEWASEFSSYANEPYSSRDDISFNPSGKWEETVKNGRGDNPEPYPWENPDNVPKDSFELESSEFTDFGEGDTGANGSSFDMLK